jgi:hypothetical protein
MAKINPASYEPLIKEPLQCWDCEEEMRNFPKLKAHLEKKWDKQVARHRAHLEKHEQS